MKSMRISEAIHKALNDQMTKEARASQIYLSYAVWADSKGYGGVSNFLFRHAEEERNHMMKFLEYILQRGGKPTIEAVEAAPADPASMHNCFEKILQHEIDNTTQIYRILKMSMDEGDWATMNFMQWFVKEQIEEETLAMNLLDKSKIAGAENATDETLYLLDRDLEKMPDEAKDARTVTAVNP